MNSPDLSGTVVVHIACHSIIIASARGARRRVQQFVLSRHYSPCLLRRSRSYDPVSLAEAQVRQESVDKAVEDNLDRSSLVKGLDVG